jgi:hypothetical protein
MRWSGIIFRGPTVSVGPSSKQWEANMGLRFVKLPDIGEVVAEDEIVEWHVAERDRVVED